LLPKVIAITRLAHPLGELRVPGSRWGIDFPQEARAAMEAWLLQSSRNRTEAPTHRYTAEEFGLSREEIRDSFADYSARFLATP